MKELSTNEKLQKRLLGKDYLRKIKHGQNQGSETGASHIGSKQRPKSQQPASTRRSADMEGSDGEEEGGRSSLGNPVTRKKKRKENPIHIETEPPQDARTGTTKPDIIRLTAEAEPAEEPLLSKKRGNNYLDEILADRSLKKKRKKSKKENHASKSTDVTQLRNSDSTGEADVGARAHPSKKNGSNHLNEASQHATNEIPQGENFTSKVEAEAEIQEKQEKGEAGTPPPQTRNNSQADTSTHLSPEERKRSKKKKKRKRNLRTQGS